MEKGFFSGIENSLKRFCSGIVRNANAYSGKKTVSAPFMKFDTTLSSCRATGKKTQKAQSTGLTISDYLAHPVTIKIPGSLQSAFAARNFQKLNLFAPSRVNKTSRYEFPLKDAIPSEGDGSEGAQTVSPPDKKSLTEPLDISVRQKIEQSIQKASSKYGVSPHLIRAIVKTESNFRVSAVSPAGARGLMQLMPKTAEYLGVKNSFDIEQNIEGGTLYLKKMLDLFENDVQLALAAYNAGPGSVRRHNGIPPYKETAMFVDKVLKLSEQKV